MARRLAVMLAGVRAGTLTQDHRTTFAYSPPYLDLEDPTPLSLAMPLRPGPHPQSAVQPWLDGLLPDSADVRARWGARFGVSPRNAFALLAHMGRDCPGAVEIWPEDEDSQPRSSDVRPLSEREIADRLAALREDQASWAAPEERWSLGGAQAKFALVENQGRWFEAIGGAPTTHIIKPGIASMATHGLNEHVCLTAARALGLHAARTRYLEFGGQPAVVIARYDRLLRDHGVVRVHQEDLCQAMSFPPRKKYETDGGPGAAAISDLLRSRHEESNWRFVEALAYNYLIGAPDGHAKNFSILLNGSQARLAPLYDIASSLPYDIDPESDLWRTAMAIGGERRFGQVGLDNWTRLARRTGVDINRLIDRVRILADDLPDAIGTVLHDLPEGASLRVRFLDRLARNLALAMDKIVR